jgi:hypothetical protein
MHLLRRIECYLRRSGTAPTTFGRVAVSDPRFVFDLRNGREPRPDTAARVAAFIDAREEGRPSCSR